MRRHFWRKLWLGQWGLRQARLKRLRRQTERDMALSRVPGFRRLAEVLDSIAVVDYPAVVDLTHELIVDDEPVHDHITFHNCYILGQSTLGVFEPAPAAVLSYPTAPADMPRRRIIMRGSDE